MSQGLGPSLLMRQNNLFVLGFKPKHMNYSRTNKISMVFLIFRTHLTPGLHSQNGHVLSPYQPILYCVIFSKSEIQKLKL
jgi:hypothetical protein